ncbi:nitrous oxide reductase accessory protein NosL [Acidovorax soli]|uniref:Nitrous oxide reductase accessory protein NosL n=1 Tax=Acidovorax soli TaxID=592050 RepID=A0A1H3W2D4_9BURK|nr:nitrous oxide reductase accessory protein NosL [Acidovorax soli]SDZ81140.1 Nitrous oxide reductase accessory protein NosL [Acidovorax soli]
MHALQQPPTRRQALLAGLAGMGALVAAAAWKLSPPDAAPVATGQPLPDDVCVVAPPTPFDPTSGLPLDAPRAIPPDARCPVCGMYPARSAQWAAQAIFANGDAHFFDSPLSLFQYLANVGQYSPGRTAQDLVARYVTDTETGAWIAANTAMYVDGSSARGPMRAGNLSAFASAEAARRFAGQRGGRVIAFGNVDGAVLERLAPGRSLAHSAHPPPLAK